MKEKPSLRLPCVNGRNVKMQKGGEAGLAAGRVSGARAAVAAAKLEAAKVRYFIFLISIFHIS